MENILSDAHTLSEEAVTLVEKWADVLGSSAGPAIQGDYKKAAVASLLEQQSKNVTSAELNEDAPTNVTGGVAKWDPVLISMVRRSAPSLIAFDVAGVQPMAGPTGQVFAMRSRYTNQSGTEAFVNEPNSSFSGTGVHSNGLFCGVKSGTVATAGGTSTVTLTGTHTTSDLGVGTLVIGNGVPDGTTVASILTATTFTLSDVSPNVTVAANFAFAANFGKGMDVNAGEGDIIPEMAISIEKIMVEAKTRALKARYSHELVQDLRAVHRLDADAELINVLSTEMLGEQNREFLRRLYSQAKIGSVSKTTPGVLDVTSDTDGRWSLERYQGIYNQIERDANGINKDTRRGKGNIVIASADVVSALAAAKILTTNILDNTLNSDWSGNLYVGNIGTMRVFVDPYAPHDFFLVGYRGASAWDAGLFFCPYVPYVLHRGQDQESLQPIIAFKTRSAYAANPFFNGGARTNGYYRISAVRGL